MHLTASPPLSITHAEAYTQASQASSPSPPRRSRARAQSTGAGNPRKKKLGSWSADEDKRLLQFMGRRDKPKKNIWAAAAKQVKTRTADQCSKRWKDALDPSLEHTPWTASEDAKLIGAYQRHGTLWTEIRARFFPTRSGLDLKNRYVSSQRFCQCDSL